MPTKTTVYSQRGALWWTAKATPASRKRNTIKSQIVTNIECKSINKRNPQVASNILPVNSRFPSADRLIRSTLKSSIPVACDPPHRSRLLWLRFNAALMQVTSTIVTVTPGGRTEEGDIADNHALSKRPVRQSSLAGNIPLTNLFYAVLNASS